MGKPINTEQCPECLCLLSSDNRCLNHGCNLYNPPLGSRRIMGGMYEKDMDTGEVRERQCYDHISEFPG